MNTLTTEFPKGAKVHKATGNDRKAFEQGVDFVYNLEAGKEKDGIFSRRSGLNQVLAKLARDKGVTIIFSYALFAQAKNKAVILGRMQQNYRLCKKYKVKIQVASLATKKEEIQTEITLKAFERLIAKRSLF